MNADTPLSSYLQAACWEIPPCTFL